MGGSAKETRSSDQGRERAAQPRRKQFWRTWGWPSGKSWAGRNGAVECERPEVAGGLKSAVSSIERLAKVAHVVPNALQDVLAQTSALGSTRSTHKREQRAFKKNGTAE